MFADLRITSTPLILQLDLGFILVRYNRLACIKLSVQKRGRGESD